MVRSKLLWPIFAIVLVLVAYSAYWVFASQQLRKGVDDWIAEQEAAGYTIEHDGVRIGGYPYRFQIRVINSRIQAPASDGGWLARFADVRANAMPHDFAHWIVSFYGPLFLENHTGPGSAIEVNASDARVSLVYDRDGNTQRVGAEIRDFVVTTHAGQAPDIQSVDAVLLNGLVEEDDRLRLRLSMSGVTASPGVLDSGVEREFGDTVGTARIDLEVSQWSALARGANALAWRQAEGTLHIEDSELEWGPAHITGTGDFILDDQARPDGRLSLRITDPDALANALVESGVVPEENEQALRLAAMLAPRGPDGVSLPFRIHDGGVYLGPVRLGGLD
ncbi:MAG: DUF2125 domain-containing protein [Alphaproteobacteria bacterium]|jgi:hypothetical protein|uniref:DUF2125 domain-containing protein n=1 Tax=Maricaulis alexandrii TaxID=2570354 RepID=UPI0011092F01|nr:DUF2125 domain-containing protein [Maricaulis alexandrii]MCR9266810.1 DUF2125 domain-containing protein [Alphaproteobacteria bacterium]